MQTPKISVVIPIRPDGNASIVLNALKNADYPKDLIETLVIRGQNPSLQRNEGIGRSSGDIVFFFDDDSSLNPDIFKQALKTFDEFKDAIGVGGPAYLEGSTYFQRATIIIMTSILGVYKIRARYKAIGKVRYTDEDELISCNLSIRRDIFNKEKGFNEALYPNEEDELINRLLKKGYKFIYDPCCIVSRPTDDTQFKFLKRIFSYGRGRMEQLFISPSPISLLRLAPLFFLLYLFILVLSLNHYLLIPFFLYLAVVFIFSTYNSRGKLILMPIVFILYVLTHVAYGLGEAYGIVKILGIKRKR